MPGRVRSRTLTIRQDRVRTRHGRPELDGQHPPIAGIRDQLSVRVVSRERQHSETSERAGAAAHRHIHVAATHTVDVSPRDVNAAVLFFRLCHGPGECLRGPRRIAGPRGVRSDLRPRPRQLRAGCWPRETASTRRQTAPRHAGWRGRVVPLCASTRAQSRRRRSASSPRRL